MENSGEGLVREKCGCRMAIENDRHMNSMPLSDGQPAQAAHESPGPLWHLPDFQISKNVNDLFYIIIHFFLKKCLCCIFTFSNCQMIPGRGALLYRCSRCSGSPACPGPVGPRGSPLSPGGPRWTPP